MFCYKLSVLKQAHLVVHKALREDNKQTHYEGLIALISGEAEKTAINLNNILNPPSTQQLSIIETEKKCVIVLISDQFSTDFKVTYSVTYLNSVFIFCHFANQTYG